MRFTDCIDIVGDRPKKYDGVKRYVSTGALDIDHISEESVEYVDYETRPSRADLMAKQGDVLFAKMAATKKALLLDDVTAQNIYSTGFFAVRARRNVIEPECLLLLINSDVFLSQKDKNASGATQKAITNKGLEAIEITLPPIQEQSLLVKKLKAVTDIISARSQQLIELDTLIKARFVEMFGEPESNTKRWTEKKMSDLCTVSSSKRILQSEQCEEGIPFLRVSDLVRRMDTGELSADLRIPEARYADLCKQGQVPAAGDILVTSRGTLGRCYICDAEDRFYFQDGMISWLSNYSNEVTPLYLSYLFSMPGFRKQIDRLQAGSTVAYLSIAMIKQLVVMLPDVELQEQFAAFVAQVDKLKVAVLKALDEAQILFDSLMQEYFG